MLSILVNHALHGYVLPEADSCTDQIGYDTGNPISFNLAQENRICNALTLFHIDRIINQDKGYSQLGTSVS